MNKDKKPKKTTKLGSKYPGNQFRRKYNYSQAGTPFRDKAPGYAGEVGYETVLGKTRTCIKENLPTRVFEKD